MCNATNGRLYITPAGVVSVQAETSFSNAQCFTSLDGAQFSLNATGYTNLTLVNGWTGAPFGTSTPAIQVIYLQLPELDPRVRALAEKTASSAKNEYDKAVNVQHYLISHYAYTLNLTGTPSKDPLAQFLFERKAGNCEYFASAMTVMLRAVGIPAAPAS